MNRISSLASLFEIRSLFILFLVPFIGYSQTLSLDGTWSFRTDPYNEGIRNGWYDGSSDDLKWDEIRVPGSWNTSLKYADYTGVAWYRKKFDLEVDTCISDVLLEFERIYSNAEVWLNGIYLGAHDFAFTSFKYNINKNLLHKSQNVLVVRVDNSFKLGATWNWGGISRSVNISALPKDRIERVLITPAVDLDKSMATVNAQIQKIGMRGGNISVSIYDPNKQLVAQQHAKVDEGQTQLTIDIYLENIVKWSFDFPNLYNMVVSFESDHGDKHTFSDRFGLRTIEIDGYKLLLNGESVRLNGVNYIPDDVFSGNTLPPDVFRRDVDLMKSCGVNMARLSHMPLPKDMLDYIDEKGILIFEEVPLWNKNHFVQANHPIALRWLTEMITERYNHPSIIGWSVGNEIGQLSYNPDLSGYLESALSLAKALDPNRFAVYVTYSADWQYEEPVLLSDIVMFNRYLDHGKKVELAHKNFPGKPIFYSEYGGSVNSEDINNRKEDYAKMLEEMRNREYLIGASVWAFNDYRSNYRDNSTQASQIRPWGMVDAFRRKKRGYWVFQQENSPLKEFNLQVSVHSDSIICQFDLLPRERFDLPAFDLHGYRIKIKYMSSKDTLKQVEIPLPTIKVGSEEQSYSHVEKSLHGVEKIEVNLMSPTDYEVQSLFYQMNKPKVPKITHWDEAQNTIRLYFAENVSASEWYVEYGTDSLDKRTEPTIENYIEIADLKYGDAYQFRLVAINNQGETPADTVINAKPRAAELPPVINYTNLTDHGIEIAYTATNEDFIYDFEYGLSPESLSRHIYTTVGGACILPLIERGKPHYLRMRKRNRYGYESTWTRVREIRKK